MMGHTQKFWLYLTTLNPPGVANMSKQKVIQVTHGFLVCVQMVSEVMSRDLRVEVDQELLEAAKL